MGVALERATFVDGAIHCKILVDPVLKIEDTTYDLDANDYFVLLAAGSSLKSTYITSRYSERRASSTTRFVPFIRRLRGPLELISRSVDLHDFRII